MVPCGVRQAGLVDRALCGRNWGTKRREKKREKRRERVKERRRKTERKRGIKREKER